MTNVAVITVSDRCHSGVRADLTGPAINEVIEAAGHAVALTALVPDDRRDIADAIRTAGETCRVVITNGGTGPGPRDVTPEATRDVIEVELPGIPEAMRASGRESTPLASISRQVAGITTGRSIVVNLPGSPKAALEGLRVVIPLLDHLVSTIDGGGH